MAKISDLVVAVTLQGEVIDVTAETKNGTLPVWYRARAEWISPGVLSGLEPAHLPDPMPSHTRYTAERFNRTQVKDRNGTISIVYKQEY